MWRAGKSEKKVAKANAKNARFRIFAWAALLSLICGAIEFGQPLEDVIQACRDTLRAREASKDIVVVGIDDRSVQELGGLGFRRRIDGQAVDSLFALGAKRVFFDRAYADPTTMREDTVFRDALKRHEGRVFLGTMNPKDMQTGKFTEVAPLPEFLAVTRVVSLNGRTSPFGLTAKLPYNGTLQGKLVRSMSATLAGTGPATRDHYRPDWSIRINSIPTISFADVVRNNVSRDQVAGKDVVVGYTASSVNDIHHILLQGWLPGVYFHVVGAQTLKQGLPVNWGWIPGFAIGLGLGWAHLYVRRRGVILATSVAACLLLGLVPLYLDAHLITVDVVPGVLLFAIVAYRGMTLRRVLRSSQTNMISGLPNLTALRQAGDRRAATLIALKMRNYAEIAASFDQVVERAMIDEVRRRVLLNGDGEDIYHSEDTLLWFSTLPMGEELAHHLEGLKAVLSSSLTIGGRDIDVSVSFGVDADQERQMASRVGSAMLCAEEAARGNDIWKFYDPERRHEAAWQLSLLSRLDQAIDSGEVWVAYQPQLDLKTNRISGAEALVRWTHPERGLIGPDEFIAVAEKHNRIEKLTRFVLDRAVEVAARINAMGIDFDISVNLSVQLLQAPELMSVIDAILDKHDFPAAKLILEITETGRLDRSGSSMAMMKALTARGIGVSIDDYGTGNATMDYLKILPSDEVKIDRQFVADIDTNTQDRILVSSTIEMAHSLGRRVVAEGVETAAVLQTLSDLGCDSAQGYLIGRPMALDALLSAIAPDRQVLAGRN